MRKQGRLEAKQKGAVVILMAFIIGLGVLVYLLNAFDPAKLRLAQDKKTYQALNAAKQALIAWSVGHVHSPGQMLWPDRHLDPGIYDGSSDCVTTAFQYSYLLGQLPSLPTTSPCLDPNNGLTVYPALSTYSGLGQEFLDAQGNRLWYAVSRNLVRDYVTSTNPIINSNIINAPTYPWLEVSDRNGNLISNRVAAVILAPGEALAGQNRSGAADASQFLDSFQIGAAVFNNRGYATPDEDFVMGEDSRNVSANDLTFVQPYNFNDKLVYITIDELMAALEKRVGEQVRSSLKTYQDTNGYYPYAAQLGTTQNYSGELNITTPLNVPATSGLTSGYLPTNHQSCSYTRTSATDVSLTCSQPFFDAATSGMTRIEYRNSPSNFTNPPTGSCTVNSSNRCYCLGAGSCSNATLTVSCTLSSCSALGIGADTGDFRIRGGKLTYRTGGCVHTTFPTKSAGCTVSTTNRITCSSMNGVTASNGDAEFGSFLPAWFNQNQWGSFVYYQMTRPASATITVGNRATEAMVATVGRPINTAPFAASRGAAQVRPSCNTLNNYLDSVENADGNTVYDATSTLRSTNYNDQNFVVAP